MKIYRMMLGERSKYADQCYELSFVGVDYDINEDISGDLYLTPKEFQDVYVPRYINNRPERSKIAAAQACSALYKLGSRMQLNDVVLCANKDRSYRVGLVTGPYRYDSKSVLPHQRPVKWVDEIRRDDMSEALRNTTGSTLTLIDVSSYFSEISQLLTEYSLSDSVDSGFVAAEAQGQSFRFERHLEDFIVENWSQTPFGGEYDIYREGEAYGKQLITEAGRIDILAQSKDKKTLLVIELKNGDENDDAVGQLARYVGFVRAEFANPGQDVKGALVVLDSSKRLRWAIAALPDAKLYQYKVAFDLIPDE
jgi:restriction system protein